MVANTRKSLLLTGLAAFMLLGVALGAWLLTASSLLGRRRRRPHNTWTYPENSTRTVGTVRRHATPGARRLNWQIQWPLTVKQMTERTEFDHLGQGGVLTFKMPPDFEMTHGDNVAQPIPTSSTSR